MLTEVPPPSAGLCTQVPSSQKVDLVVGTMWAEQVTWTGPGCGGSPHSPAPRCQPAVSIASSSHFPKGGRLGARSLTVVWESSSKTPPWGRGRGRGVGGQRVCVSVCEPAIGPEEEEEEGWVETLLPAGQRQRSESGAGVQRTEVPVTHTCGERGRDVSPGTELREDPEPPLQLRTPAGPSHGATLWKRGKMISNFPNQFCRPDFPFFFFFFFISSSAKKGD